MARYSRRTGPLLTYNIPAGLTIIPGLTLTRYFDDGELLLLGQIRFFNDEAADIFFNPLILLDSATQIAPNTGTTVPPADQQTLTLALIHPITEGQHTLSLAVQSIPDAQGQVIALASFLTLIQLPLWDSDADIL